MRKIAIFFKYMEMLEKFDPCISEHKCSVANNPDCRKIPFYIEDKI